MDEKYSISRIVTIGLLYPAVLGSIFYSLFVILWSEWSNKSHQAFMLGSTDEIVLKLLLVGLTLSFFFCDYAYSSWERPFLSSYMLLNILVLICLYIAYAGIHLDSKDAPSLSWLSFSYVVVALVYFVWDCFNRDKERFPDYYHRMRQWQFGSAGIIVLTLVVCHFWAWLAQFHAWIFLCVLSLMNAGFWMLLCQKRRLILEALKRDPVPGAPDACKSPRVP